MIGLMDTEELLEKIEVHLAKAGISAAAFGKEAMNDPAFVYELRKGRRVWPETADRVMKFIERQAA